MMTTVMVMDVTLATRSARRSVMRSAPTLRGGGVSGAVGHPARREPWDVAGEEELMKATWNGVVLAESDATVVVEGNH